MYQNPTILPAKDLNPVVCGDNGFSISCAEIILSGTGVDFILFPLGEFHIFSNQLALRNRRNYSVFVLVSFMTSIVEEISPVADEAIKIRKAETSIVEIQLRIVFLTQNGFMYLTPPFIVQHTRDNRRSR